jgi:hypothetical protein
VYRATNPVIGILCGNALNWWPLVGGLLLFQIYRRSAVSGNRSLSEMFHPRGSVSHRETDESFLAQTVDHGADVL